MRLTTRDEQRLSAVDPRLAAVVREAALRTRQRFMVVEGRRTLARQQELYAQGRSTPGKVVTWTMKSKHLDGLAVDLAPLDEQGAIPWGDFSAFAEVNKAMQDAAQMLEHAIRWGKDWNRNGIPGEKGETDSPHWELVA